MSVEYRNKVSVAGKRELGEVVVGVVESQTEIDR